MPDKSPARVVSPDAITFTPRFEYGHMTKAATVSGPEDGTRLGSGYVKLTQAEIPWTVKYDEVILVLEGSLTVRTADGDLAVEPHQSIWLPKGTALTYVAEDALVFFAIEPADWAKEA